MRLNDHLEHDCGPTVFQHACKMGLEGLSRSGWDRAIDPVGRGTDSSSGTRMRPL
jgi:hypothetical protein